MADMDGFSKKWGIPMVSSTAQNFAAAMKRIIKGMPYGSQTEIAEKLGVSRQYLNDLLSGRKRWSLHTADYREAMSIYRDICRKADLEGCQEKSESV